MTTRMQVWRVLSVMGLGTIVHVGSAQSDVPVVSSYELVKTDLTVNEPVFLRFTAENGLGYPVEMDLGIDFYGNTILRFGRLSFNGGVTEAAGQDGLAGNVKSFYLRLSFAANHPAVLRFRRPDRIHDHRPLRGTL